MQVNRSSSPSHNRAVSGPFIRPSPYLLLSFLFFHLASIHSLLHCPVLLTVTRHSRVLDSIALIGMMRMSTGVAQAAGTWLVWIIRIGLRKNGCENLPLLPNPCCGLASECTMQKAVTMHHHHHAAAMMESEETHIGIYADRSRIKSYPALLCHPALKFRYAGYWEQKDELIPRNRGKMIMSLEVRRWREGPFTLPSAAVSSSSLTSLLIALPALCH